MMLSDRRDVRSVPAVAAVVWHDELDGGTTDSATGGGAGYAVRAFSETPCAVVQPVLSDDIVCLHGGGPKMVHRQCGSLRSVHDIDKAR